VVTKAAYDALTCSKGGSKKTRGRVSALDATKGGGRYPETARRAGKGECEDLIEGPARRLGTLNLAKQSWS